MGSPLPRPELICRLSGKGEILITPRRYRDRGHTKIDWLESYHTFSFDQFYDPKFMSFRSLRVLNEDWVRPGAGFPTHPHRDMEIITVVLEGALEHKDSMGNGSVIRPGDIQRMSAGTGITHSEFNPSETEPVHLQPVLFTDRCGITRLEFDAVQADRPSCHLQPCVAFRFQGVVGLLTCGELCHPEVRVLMNPDDSVPTVTSSD